MIPSGFERPEEGSSWTNCSVAETYTGDQRSQGDSQVQLGQAIRKAP